MSALFNCVGMLALLTTVKPLSSKLGSVLDIVTSMSSIFAAAASKSLNPLISPFFDVVCRHVGLLILESGQLLQ
jgi:hypothetical protein